MFNKLLAKMPFEVIVQQVRRKYWKKTEVITSWKEHMQRADDLRKCRGKFHSAYRNTWSRFK